MIRYFIIFYLLFFSVCHAQTNKSQLLVSIPPQKQFISAIAGDHYDIRVMLSPGESPETFSPSPRQLASVSSASAYFQISVPFERHWTASLEALNPEMQIVKCCGKLINQTGVSRNIDMHYWTDPVFVQNYLKLVLDEVVKFSPDKKDLFESNYNQYIFSLKKLDSYIINRFKNNRINQFIISHSSLDSYASRYGLTQLSLEQGGRETGPRIISNIFEAVDRFGIDTIFVIEQFRTRAVDNLAVQIEAKIELLDPLAEDYLANMYEMTEKLATAMGSRE